MKIIMYQLMAKWFACRITSGRKSVQYGIRFSYPLYITIVALGIFLMNPFILFVTTLIAFFGIILPMHPFDYLYNFGAGLLKNTNKILGRGSELQVNSSIALVFNVIVIILIIFRMPIDYAVLSIIYLLNSIFFVCIFLFKTNSN